jgi:hypothetical protein
VPARSFAAHASYISATVSTSRTALAGHSRPATTTREKPALYPSSMGPQSNCTMSPSAIRHPPGWKHDATVRGLLPRIVA